MDKAVVDDGPIVDEQKDAEGAKAPTGAGRRKTAKSAKKTGNIDANNLIIFVGF
jgi:hypothetical protein